LHFLNKEKKQSIVSKKDCFTSRLPTLPVLFADRQAQADLKLRTVKFI